MICKFYMILLAASTILDWNLSTVLETVDINPAADLRMHISVGKRASWAGARRPDNVNKKLEYQCLVNILAIGKQLHTIEPNLVFALIIG